MNLIKHANKFKQYICYPQKNIFRVVFYNSISVENRYFVKVRSNYDRIILKNHKFESLA